MAISGLVKHKNHWCAATSTGSSLKVNKLMHLLCKFHMCTHLKTSKPLILMCDLDQFSKIQSQIQYINKYIRGGSRILLGGGAHR